MTVPNDFNTKTYELNGSATQFDTEFQFYDEDHLNVYLVVGDTAIKLTLGSDYSVSGAGDPFGGHVTYPLSGSPGDNGELLIERILPITQNTSFRNQGAYYPETVEQLGDESRMIDQQLQDQADRSLKRDVGEQDWNGEGRVAYNFSNNDPLTPTELVTFQALQQYVQDIETGAVGDSTLVNAQGKADTRTLSVWMRDLAYPNSATGSNNEQTLVQALDSRNHRIVSPEMFGAVGDGIANDRQAWMDAIATGFVVDAMPGAVYNIGAGFNIDTPTTIRTGGSKFLITADVGAVAMRVDAKIYCDAIEFEIAAGITVPQVFNIFADDCEIGSVTINSIDQQNNRSLTSYNAHYLVAHGIKIGRVSIKNFDNAMAIRYSGCIVDNIEIDSYVRGLWLNQTVNFKFGTIAARNRSPNALYTAGHNGVLFDAAFEVYGNRIDIMNAGEHGVRFAGSNGTSRVYISEITCVNVGGSGVKWRCATGSTMNYIDIGSIYCQDCGDDVLPVEGQAGLRIDRVRDMHIGKFTVVKRSKAYSCGLGIAYFDCQRVNIGSVTINDVAEDSVQVRTLSTDDDSNPITRNSQELTIGSGRCMGAGQHMVYLEARTSTFRNIDFNLTGQLIQEGVLRALSYTGGSLAGINYLNLRGTRTATPIGDPVSGNALNASVSMDVAVEAGPATTLAMRGSTWHNLSTGVRSILNSADTWVAMN